MMLEDLMQQLRNVTLDFSIGHHPEDGWNGYILIGSLENQSEIEEFDADGKSPTEVANALLAEARSRIAPTPTPTETPTP